MRRRPFAPPFPRSNDFFASPPLFFCTVASGQGQWSRGTPPFPLTGRSYAVTTVNQSAFISVGGRRDDNSLSSISLGYDPREFAPHPTQWG